MRESKCRERKRTSTVRNVILTLALALSLCLTLPGGISRATWDGGMDSTGATSPGRRWYFAEGCTRPGFEEWLSVLNPGAEQAGVGVHHICGTGERKDTTVRVPPRSRATINVNDSVGGPEDVSILVEATEDVVAERTVYFRYQGLLTGGHVVTGAKEPRADWYFAEGCVRTGFDTWLSMMNPAGGEAVVDIEYMFTDGHSETRSGVRLAPGSRSTVAVHGEGLGIGRHDDSSGDVSIRVGSRGGARIVCERSMYFRYRGLTGGHDVMGAPSPATSWYFAEGCARTGFDTWLCLQNPGDSTSLVDIEYLCGDGVTERRNGVEVPAHGRRTIDVCEPTLGIGRRDDPHGDVSIRIRSANGVPVVCERSMYFSYEGVIGGGHVALGVTAPAEEWYFAEGCVRSGFDTWLCIQAPHSKDATVDIDYVCGDHTSLRREGVRVPAGGRISIPVFRDGEGIGRHDDGRGDVAVKVTSSNRVPVVCERSVYFTYRNFGPDWRTIDRGALAAAYGFNEVASGNRNKPLVALTFDCGSGPGNGGQLLDVLKGFGVRCTFFVTGRFALTCPDLIRRMAAEGHEVCNHTFDHPQAIDRLGPVQLDDQIARTEQAVSDLTGVTTRPWFRFPYGRRNAAQVSSLGSMGYMSVYWTVAGEWYDNEPAGAICARVLPKAGPGAIILLHLDTPSQPTAVASIIPALRSRGLEPVTVTEVLLPDDWYP